MHRPRFVLPQLGIAVLTVVVMRWCPRYSLETPAILEDTFVEAPLDRAWQHGKPAELSLSVSEGIHITASSNRRPHVCQRRAVPAGASHFLVCGIARAENLHLGDTPWKGGRCLLYFPDKSGVVDWSVPHTAVQLTGTTEWEAFSRIFPVPPNAEQFEIRIENAGDAGTFTVRELTIQTLHVASIFEALRWLLGACWTAMVLLFLVRSLKRHGLRTLFVSIPVLFILVGVVLPDNHLFSIVHGMRRVVEGTIEQAQSSGDAVEASGLGAGVRGRIRSRHVLGLTKRAAHVGLFGLLALGTCACIFSARTNRGTLHTSISRFAIPLAVFAACTEIAQMLTLDRSPKLRDWCLDMTGIIAGLVIAWLIIRHFHPTAQDENAGDEDAQSSGCLPNLDSENGR